MGQRSETEFKYLCGIEGKLGPVLWFMNCRGSAGEWMDRLMRGRRRLARTGMVAGQDEDHGPWAGRGRNSVEEEQEGKSRGG